MIENGFAAFFLLSLLAGGAGLVHLFRTHWSRISAALAGELNREQAATLSAISQRPTSEVPWVAQRLLVGKAEEFRPARGESDLWRFALIRERPRQLSFPFGNAR
jgi:hypothetical protein